MILKTLVLATPRSWGTVFQERLRADSLVPTLSLGQPYFPFVNLVGLSLHEYNTGTQAISEFLNSLVLSFVCKLEPYQIYHQPSESLINLDKLNLRMYSKIYVLDKLDKKSRMASLLWSQHVGKWHYLKNELQKEITPTSLIVEDWVLENLAREYKILDMFCDYLNANCISYEKIYTETLAFRYTSNPAINDSLHIRPSNVDYNKNILNLEELYQRFNVYLNKVYIIN